MQLQDHGGRQVIAVSRPSGQALVEFALVLPIVLLLLMGLFDLGRAVFLANSLTNAAREGARFAIVHQSTPLVGARVQAMAFTGGVSNAGPPYTGLLRYFEQNADGTLGPACNPIRVGCIAVVTASASWSPITPIIGSLVGAVPLQGRSELPVEFVCPNPAIPAFSTSASCTKQP